MNPRQFSTNTVFYQNIIINLPGALYFNDHKTEVGTYINNTRVDTHAPTSGAPNTGSGGGVTQILAIHYKRQEAVVQVLLY